MSKDKAKAPNVDDNAAANASFLDSMLGGQDAYTLDQGAEMLANSDSVMDALLGKQTDETSDQDDDRDQSDAEDNGDEPSDDVDDDEEADDDGKDDVSPDDESEESNGSLLTRDEKGNLKAVGLEDVVVPFELDGEKQELTLAEIQQELTDNRLRRSDYTRKTQDIARKVQEGARKATAERQADLDRGYERLEVVLSAFGANLDQDVTFEQLKAQYGGDAEKAGNALTQRQAIKASLAGAESDMQARRQQAMQENASQTLEAFRETDPRFRSADAFNKELDGLREYFLSEGLDDNDIAAILQKPAYLNIAMAAMRGDKLVKKTAQKPIKQKKSIRLGTSKAPATADANKSRRTRKPNRASRSSVIDQFTKGPSGLSEQEAAAQIERALFSDK